jgi:ankyrin repeat protein
MSSSSEADCKRLLQALVTGRLSDVQSALQHQQQASSTLCRSLNGNTALAVAAQQGDVRACRLVHAHGYPVDSTDKHGFTPLAWTAFKGHDDIAAFLLQQGAQPDTYDEFGLSPVHKAAAYDHPKVIRALLRSQQSCSADIRTGSVSAPAHYEAQSAGHQTPLICASRTGAGARAAAVLIEEFGASVSAQDASLNTALHYAAKNNDLALMRVLLRNGAPADTLNHNGQKPVDLTSPLEQPGAWAVLHVWPLWAKAAAFVSNG